MKARFDRRNGSHCCSRKCTHSYPNLRNRRTEKRPMIVGMFRTKVSRELQESNQTHDQSKAGCPSEVRWVDLDLDSATAAGWTNPTSQLAKSACCQSVHTRIHGIPTLASTVGPASVVLTITTQPARIWIRLSWQMHAFGRTRLRPLSCIVVCMYVCVCVCVLYRRPKHKYICLAGEKYILCSITDVSKSTLDAVAAARIDVD